MGAEKVGSKSGGFFHLFDWNRKSRKKLFASVSPEGTKQARKSYDNFPASNLRLLSDDDVGATFSIKASSDYSCASSVSDEEGNGIRAPGVVARLMGLDTMPMAAGVSEPYSSPLYELQSQSSMVDRQYQKSSIPDCKINNSRFICMHNGASMVDRQYQKSSIPDCKINNSRFICMHNGADVYTKKVAESKVLRMPSSPIERFKTEILPPRSAKSLPSTHLKLLSPIRNPRIISPKDAANIMEAAAKILEPGIQASPNVRVPSIGLPSIPFRIRDPKECAASSQSSSRILESSKRPVESNSMKYLRGRPMNRSWNCSESDTSCRASPEMEDNSLVGVKGKSISLAIQAKVNVQRREGLSTLNTTKVNQKQSNEIKESRPFKSQVKTQKDRLQKKAAAPSTASGVLKQNNQKQNSLTSRDKISPIPSASIPQRRKSFSAEASTSVRTKSLNKPQTHLQPQSQGISKGGCRRKGSPNLESVVASSNSRTNHLYRKKRLIEVDFDSDKRGCDNNSIVGRQEKRIQHNIVFDEQLKQTDDTRKSGMDVVSFTFTSSALKPFPGSQTVMITKKQDPWDYHHAQVPGERKVASTNGNKLPAIGLNMTCGDSLSILLDQKLRELTIGLNSPSSHLGKVTSQDASESSSAMTVEQEKDSVWESCTDNDSSTSDSGFSSVNCQTMLNPGLKEAEVTESSRITGASKESENRQASPFSVLEPSFSYDSCMSLESCGSASGVNTTMDSTMLSSTPSFLGSMKSLSILAQGVPCFDPKMKPFYPDVDLEVSDSVSSFLQEIIQPKQIEGISRKYQKETPKWEVEYVNEILSATKLNSQNFSVEYRRETISSPIFEQLEIKKPPSTNKSGRGERKLLFDCVRECLDFKAHRCFNAGYKTWSKGAAVVSRGEFAEGIFKEVSAWSGMGDCMVDELVYKDMSSHQGRWLDFEADEFGAGGEIGNEILATLIDEVIAELKV